ncbi:MAG TPA: hypothetical protein ENK34_02145 [Rhodobacteraceae bacterium]|nr:hypothetical protein [Paracoccaceae bacterium]
MIRFTLLLWLLVLPSFGAAQQVTGTITSYARTWYLTRLDGQSKSGWSGDGQTAIVTMFGHATDSTIKELQGALTIRFYLFDPTGARFVNEVDIVYYEDAAKGAYVTKGHGDGSIIELEDVRLDGEIISLQGRFDVTLLFTDDFGATLDPDDTRQFSGKFKVTLTQEVKN